MILKYIGGICILSFCTIRIYSYLDAYHQHKLVVYNIPGHQAVQLVDRKENWLITTGINREHYLQSIQPSLIKWYLNSPKIIFAKQYEFLDNKIAIIDTSISFRPLKEKQSIDFLILSKNIAGDIKSLLKNFSIHQIILDSSIPEWKAQLLKTQCDSLKIPCFDVRKEGAFVRNL